VSEFAEQLSVINPTGLVDTVVWEKAVKVASKLQAAAAASARWEANKNLDFI